METEASLVACSELPESASVVGAINDVDVTGGSSPLGGGRGNTAVVWAGRSVLSDLGFSKLVRTRSSDDSIFASLALSTSDLANEELESRSPNGSEFLVR